jgi:hypothetical protein
MDKYYYLFNEGKLIHTDVNNKPDGYITFGDGNPIDWTKYEYINGELKEKQIIVEQPIQQVQVPITQEEIKQQRINNLDATLSINKTKLTNMVSDGILTGNDAEIRTARESWNYLIADYPNKVFQINAGNDPFATSNDGWNIY